MRWKGPLRRRAPADRATPPKKVDALHLIQALETERDRYRLYEEVRAQGKIVGSHFLPLYVSSDYQTAVDVLRDGRFTKAGHGPRSAAAVNSPLFGSMLFVDPPQHTRLRRLATQAFTPAAVQQLEVAVEKIAHRLLDEMTSVDSADLMQAYAGPLPRMVIGEILGITDEDITPITRAGQVVGAALDGPLSRATEQEVQAASAELRTFFLDLFEKRRGQRRDDLLQRLIDAHEEGGRLNRDELLSMCSLLLFAGYETTVNLIGNGTLLLLQQPQVLEQLQNDPSLIPNAVNEMLRMEAPIQFTGRRASEPIEYGGVEFASDAVIVILLAGANRDPETFPDPNRLDVRRENARDHLAFSSGIHFCLGARLARLEGEIAFKALLGRCRDMQLAGPAPFRETAVLRALEALPLRLRVEP